MYICTYEIVYATQISLLALEQTTEGSTTSVPIPSTFLGFYIKQNNVIKKNGEIRTKHTYMQIMIIICKIMQFIS